MKRQHEIFGLFLGSFGQRYVNCHLIAIEIGVVTGTNAGMNSYSRTFNKYGIKGLNTQFVKCGCAIEKYRMIFGDFLQYIENFCLSFLEYVFGIFDIGSDTSYYKFAQYKGFEKFQRHFFGKSA